MNIVQQFKYNNSNDYELIKRIRKQLTTLVVIGTDCTGSCKSKYHTITTMMTLRMMLN